MSDTRKPGLSRRDLLRYSTAGAVGAVALRAVPAAATPAAMKAAIAKVVGEAKVSRGRVKLEVPPLSENGNLVPCTVKVESPMTEAEHVRAIHVFNEKNPQPNVVSYRLGPRAGIATVGTRIRLSETQTVVAIAEMSDGSFWSAQADVIVTQGACLEDGT